MLTVVLTTSYEQALKDIQASIGDASAYEFRLDLFENISFDKIACLRRNLKQKVIFTLRMQHHGGCFSGDFQKRWKTLEPYLSLKPDFVDLEQDTPKEHFEILQEIDPHIGLILSYHNLEKTPLDLEEKLIDMLKTKASIYKIAAKASSIEDCFLFLRLLKKYQEKKVPLIAIPLGEKGQWVRLLSPLFSVYFFYCSVEVDKQRKALGHFSLKELVTIYHLQRHHPLTKVYALLGTQVSQSPSHYIHNQFFKNHNLEAIYIKIALEENELKRFLSFAKEFAFEGFSVTVSLKEKAFQLVEVMSHAKPIEAINTLVKQEGEWIGDNTDGLGAVEAIEELIPLNNKRCLILGAGGTAKSIAHELVKRLAHVTIVNRDKKRAETLAKRSSADYYSLDEFILKDLEYDVVVQTTSVGMAPKIEDSILKESEIPNCQLVMDVLMDPLETKFLQNAKRKGLPILSGKEMFIHQAVGQYGLWFQHRFSKEAILSELKKLFLEMRSRIDHIS